VTIIYENGTVQNFSVQSTAASSSASENSSEQELSQTDVIPTSGRITQKGDAYFINNVQIADNFTAVEKWISTNQANIYNDFKDYKKKTSRMCTTGGVFLATGLVVGGVAGGTLLGLSDPGDDSAIAGAALLSAGSICLGIGIPLYVVGLVRYRNANLVSYYNEHAHSYSQTPLILELQSSQNGIGLALKF